MSDNKMKKELEKQLRILSKLSEKKFISLKDRLLLVSTIVNLISVIQTLD